jgi:hypothetical protein
MWVTSMSTAGSTTEVSYSRHVDLPPPPDQQVPLAPAVPAQRSGEGPPVPPATSVPVQAQRGRRNWRLIIAILVAALSTLCAGGSLVGYIWYAKATTPDRSTPDLVVRQYLQATFEEADTSRASLFTCSKPESLTEVQDTLTDVHQRESRFGVKIVVAWEGFATSEQGKRATVDLNLLIRVPEANGSTSESLDRWRFTTVDERGWRVCGAHKVS